MNNRNNFTVGVLTYPSARNKPHLQKRRRGARLGVGVFPRSRMPETNDSGSGFPPWPLHDVAFASDQLSIEYPTLARALVSAAVDSAAPFVSPDEGRVQLMLRAREFIRDAL